jgi:hypothetical protein
MATGRIPDPNSAPITAKGDLYTYSTVPARLAVGSNGDTLVADSSTTTGLRWQGDYAAGKNKIINGDFRINQRAFSSTTSNEVYTFDRWATADNTTVTYSAQTFTLGAAPVAGYEAINFARIATTTDSSAGEYAIYQQKVEDVRTLAGQTLTVSFWAKASAGTPKVGVELFQIFGTGGSPSAATGAAGQSVTISTSWTRYSATIVNPSISGKTLGTNNNSFTEVNFWITAGSSFNTRSGSVGNQSATIDIWGVQVEAGSTATAFQTATGTLQGELAACQRYHHRFSAEGQATAALINSGLAFSTTVAMFIFNLGTTMRTGPGTMEVSNQGIYRPTNATAYSGGTWSLNQTFDNSVRVIYTHGSAIFVAGESLISSSTTTSNYFAFDAEL